MNNEFKLKEEELEKEIEKISGSMAQEGMPLTVEVKENIRKCLLGTSTTEIECQKVIERYRKTYE